MGAEEGSGEGDGKDPKDEAVCLPFPAPTLPRCYLRLAAAPYIHRHPKDEAVPTACPPPPPSRTAPGSLD